MLQSLSNLSIDEAADVLGGLIQSLLPSPVEDAVPLDEAAKTVLVEVRTQLKLSPDDVSSRASGRILNTLTEEFRELLLTSESEASARARLVERNELPPGALRLEFAASLNEVERPVDERSQVEAAIRRPDAFQFDAVGQYLGKDAKRGHLLVARAFDELFTLLVEALREGEVLTVVSVWRVYHDDVRIPDSREPLAVLRAFVEVFGIAFPSRSGPESVKFVEYAVLLGSEAPWYLDPPEGSRRYSVHQLIRRSELQGAWKLALIFAIDLDHYAAALRRHGVRMRKVGNSRRT